MLPGVSNQYMNRKEFHEGFVSKKTSPLYKAYYDFDWSELETRLGESVKEFEQHDYVALGQALKAVLQWLLPQRGNRANWEKTVAMKVFVLCWLVDSSLLENQNLRKLAKQIGCSEPNMSKTLMRARVVFNLRKRS